MGILGTQWDDPQTQGLLGAALSMLAASGPSPQRKSVGQVIGLGGLEGMRQYDQAKVIGQRDEELRRRNALVDLQMKKLQKQEEEDLAAQKAVMEEARRLSTPQYPLGTSVVSTDPSKQPQNVTPTMPTFNPLEAIARGVPLKAVGTMQGLFPKQEPYTLKPGEARFLGGKQVASLPAEQKQNDFERVLGSVFPPGSPEYKAALQNWVMKQATHSPAVQVSYGAPFAAEGAGGPGYFRPPKGDGPAIPVVDPQGRQLRPNTPPKEKDLTEAQAKAATFLSQMVSASKELEAIGGDQGSLMTQFNVQLAGGATNPVTSELGQRIRQSQEQWSEAYLRFKTGAATTKDEIARNVRTFFPRIGDLPNTVDQKKRMRQQAEQDMRIAAGRGAPPVEDKKTAKSERKTVDGKNYVKIDGKWYEE